MSQELNYKKLCEDLRRVYEFHGWDFTKEAADAIEQIQGQCRTWETNANYWNTEYRKLQADNENLKKQLEWQDKVIELAQRKQAEAEAERDAAVADLRTAHSCGQRCILCKNVDGCADRYEQIGSCKRFEWRGVKQEDAE